MEENKTRLARLFDQDEWTEEDQLWLLHYLEETISQELNALMFEKFNQNQLPPEQLEKDISEKLLLSIHEKIGVRKQIHHASIFKIWHKRIAAAAVIAVCILGVYLVTQNRWRTGMTANHTTTKPGNKRNFKDDVAPGTNKALLTLADGTSIVLDDVKSGTIARQGATKILKFDGKLTYDGAGPASGEALYNTISTPRGGEYQVVLPDGSQVWLNAASSIRFPTAFTGVERRVEITGEAYFEVAKNQSMPFIVKIRSSEIKVFGTHFNIMAYDDEGLLKTTLLEGSIQFNNGDQQVMLKPGQQSQLVANSQLRVLNNIHLEEVVAWKNGMFHFYKTDMETMMRQIARWYDIDVVYENNKAEERFFADIPRNTNLSDVLKALELTGKVQFELEGNKVVVK